LIEGINTSGKDLYMKIDAKQELDNINGANELTKLWKNF
jgi:hypothetical protein